MQAIAAARARSGSRRKRKVGRRNHRCRTRQIMITITNDSPLGVNAMHAECPERKRFDYVEENGFFHCRHDFRLEPETLRRTFQWKKISLVACGSGHTYWIHSYQPG